jgi:hypothetical protein
LSTPIQTNSTEGSQHRVVICIGLGWLQSEIIGEKTVALFHIMLSSLDLCVFCFVENGYFDAKVLPKKNNGLHFQFKHHCNLW